MAESPQNGGASAACGWSTRGWVPFAALVLLFVGVRVVLMCLTGVIEVDSVRYVSLGRFWVSGDFSAALDTEYHPLYPIVLGLFTAPFADPELPARVLSLLLSVATMAPLGWIGWMLGKRKASIATLFIFALLPHPWRFSIQILSEPLCLLFISWQCAFVIRMFRGWDWRFAAAAGLCGGAAYLTRPEGFLPLLALAPVALIPGEGAPRLHRRFAVALAAVPAFLVIAAPYMLLIGGLTAKKRVDRLAGAGEYSHQEPKWFSLKAKHPGPVLPPAEPAVKQPVAAAEPPPSGRAETLVAAPAFLDLSAWEMAGKDPDHLNREIPVENPLWVALWHFLMAGHFISPFYVLAGFVLSRIGRKPWRPDLFLLVLAAGNFAMIVALLVAYRYTSLRHVMPATLATMPMAAVGALELWRIAGIRKPLLGRGFFLLCATAFVLFFFCQGFRPLRYPKRTIKTAAAALHEKTMPGEILLSDDVRYSFYAGRGFLGLGIMSVDDLDRLTKERGVRFLVVERNELERRVPGFAGRATSLGWRELDLGIAGGSTFMPVAYEKTR